MTLNKAINLIEKEYEKAKKLEWVHKPLAYTIYKVWRIVDAEKEKEDERT